MNIIEDMLKFLEHKPKCLVNRPEDGYGCDCGLETARNRFLSLMSANPETRKVLALEKIATNLELLTKNGITVWNGEN